MVLRWAWRKHLQASSWEEEEERSGVKVILSYTESLRVGSLGYRNRCLKLKRGTIYSSSNTAHINDPKPYKSYMSKDVCANMYVQTNPAVRGQPHPPHSSAKNSCWHQHDCGYMTVALWLYCSWVSWQKIGTRIRMQKSFLPINLTLHHSTIPISTRRQTCDAP